MVFRSLTAAATTLAVALVFTAGASAAPADLDTSFGAGGLFTQVADHNQQITSMALAGDGKLVFAGYQYDPAANPQDTAFVGRLNANGTLDQSFGTGGMTYLTDPTYGLRFNAVGIDGLGRVLAGGVEFSAPGVGLLARFDSGGILDPTFNTVGVVTQLGDATGYGIAGLAIQPDGSVITGGNTATGSDEFMTWKVTEAGSNATGFAGPNGYAVFPFFGDGEYSSDVAAYPDGRFALVGEVKDGANPTDPNVFGAYRFTAGGDPDPTFESTGRTIVPIGNGVVAYPTCAVALANGGLLIGGSVSQAGSGFLFGLVRLNADGTRDGSFGSDGKVEVDQGGYDGTSGCAVQPDGKIVIAAFDSGSDRSFDFARLNSNGSLDTTFGNGGKTEFIPSGGEAVPLRMLLRPNGRIVAGGSVNPTATSDGSDIAVLQLLGGNAATAPVTPVPLSKITSPSKSKLKAKKFKKIAGTAGPAGSVAKVEVAIRRIDRKQLKKRRCLWVKSSKGALKKVKSTTRKRCTRQVWLKATGTTNWSYKLKKALKPGSYEIYSRTTLTTGAAQTAFTKGAGDFRTLKLTR